MSSNFKSIPRLRPLRRSDLFPILANLLPILGVAFWGWSPVEAFTVYALETLIIGIFTLAKMGVVIFHRPSDGWQVGEQTQKLGGIFFMVFFTVHFGMFAAIQTSIFSSVAGIAPPGAGPLHFFLHWYSYITVPVGYMLAAFVISHFANHFMPFMLNGEYRTIPMTKLMFQPYGRIIIQQFTVIIGSMLLLFKFGLGFMIVFVAIKLYFDLFINFDKMIDKSIAEAEKRNA